MKKILATGMLAMLISTAAQAAQWPMGRPIRIVQGFSTAAATQMLAMEIAHVLSTETGARAFVESRPGAAGNIGAEVVANSAPDGYTLYVATSATQCVNPLIYNKLSFDPQKSFAPITLLGDIPNILVVNENLHLKTLADFVHLAKSEPGKLHYGSSGYGTSMQLAAEQFKMASGIDIVHVPYSSSGTAVTDLMGGRIQAMFHQVPAVIGMIKSHKLSALAVTSRERVQALPDIPSVAETYPGFVSTTWYGLFAPAGTPAPIIARINQIVTKALRGELGKKLLALGITPRPSTPQEEAQAIENDTAKWRKVVQHAHIHVN